ncbi:helix-turn-helix domain-containing protein [Moellerella wisconsensis]|uniref:Helix-turn-helix domain-containing protein n=1 Tax=Moellerella wisconsensis TaxID=158849 RepID=A0ACD3Y5X6_9GAMM|nr:helix-turn-helix transcriptional regulator [Moellerella wisconsensis]KLN96430.1 hypothetical protein VK86_09720 [Moellerella wisconsensis]UNH23665.1 helix-turn-helix domain-containing protein [Moellerella wisconsensis]UNH26753.1 helix-turn-helix domain-containing protein [Moellerella wisconsensis]UNH38395.1 helix-turn-helix domain-containing protein [Moellerella wisconsensis]UNH41910.1 helix-turn-helix domain-containing protein [Moellerella wisconsensis]
MNILDKYDWHPADIIAAIKKQGTCLSQVSRRAGLASSTLSNALQRPWPKGEAIIAHQLGISPMDIWPSRYINNKANTFWLELTLTNVR